MLELRDVSKRFGNTTVLEPLTLSIEPGQTTVLIGPSGCGKSTLLRLMIGLIAPDRGSVRFEGQEFTRENALLLRRKMGYVIQEGGLFPHLTARGNVALMARYLGWAEPRIGEKIHTLAELTHFPPDGLDRYPVQLSGGQRQRVGLMRALMLDPDLLLLDEPLGALDPLVRFDLQQDLRDIFRKLNKTVVLVTHDMSEASFFGDVVLLMYQGRIVQRGRIEDMIKAPADPFVTRFLNAQRVVLNGEGGGKC
jgi:osmoprotectant transport system ATP-binding protein